MGNIWKTALLSAVALAAIPAATAMAADAVPVPPAYFYPPPPPVEYGSNWYLRIDGGLKWYRPPVVTFNEPTLGFDVPGAGEFIDETMSHAGLIGVGYAGSWARRRFRFVVRGHPDASGPRRLR